MKINKEKCVGCCACQSSCPVNAISYVDGKCIIDESKCMNCKTCMSMCPMQAISE